MATEQFREHGDLVELANILIIEVKKANVRLTREELNQTEGYVEDLAASGAVYGNPRINAYVVGKDLDRSLSRFGVRTIGDPEYGRVEACTFEQLIHTAERRLFRLRDNLKSRYENIPALDLINRVLSEPIQIPMDAPVK